MRHHEHLTENTLLNVLFEDNHLLVLSKPAPLPTMGTDARTQSLLDLAKAYIREKFKKPGNVYLGVVSRLDSHVTGVVVFARTSKAAARLSAQYAAGTVQKTYWAIVSGRPESMAGEFSDWLIHDDADHVVRCCDPRAPGAKQATLSYRVLTNAGRTTWLEIEPKSGRKHQIRVQFASRGLPILGDQKYGSKDRFPRGIALHSRRLQIAHPTLGTQLTFEAPVPDYWPPLPS